MSDVELPGYRAATLEALISMSEAALQAKMIEPLLRLMGFEHVRDMSGPNERGKDLVAVKSEFGRPRLYAIQIKKFSPSGKHTKTTAMTNVVTQLRQMMLEPVLDPLVKVERPPDRGVFITPYAIHRDALASAIEQVRDLERREITIIDGPVLVDLILKYMPDAITDLDTHLRYRVQVAKAADRIPESTAFELSEDLSLDDLFVEISVVYGKPPFRSSAQRRAERGGPKTIRATNAELATLRSLYQKHVNGNPRIWVPPRRKQTDKTIVREVGDTTLAEVDLDPLLDAIDSKLRSYSVALASAGRSPELVGELNQAIAKGIDIAKSIDLLVQLDLMRENWPDLVRSAHAASARGDTTLLAASALAGIDYPTLITGEPGGGKTTLLRRLSQIIARTSSSQLPLFIPLVRVRHPTRHEIEDRERELIEALVDECRFALSSVGYRADGEQLVKEIDAGKFRLLLDGLDEAGSAAPELFASIQRFWRCHQACPITVTCRDTLSLAPWGEAVHLQLNPFTDAQLTSFIANWYRAEPTARGRLSAWLDENPRMKTAARTPMNAALLCSLHHADAEMPTTEVELYDKRFVLLLGKWERAKGIGPLSPRLRHRYWHFLMDLARTMQEEQTRMIDYRRAIEHARQFDLEGFDADSIVLDCAQRGIFIREDARQLSFGHLTYQEFLVAKWLSHNNPIGLILERLEAPWWKKTIEFYAAIHGDISALIEEALAGKRIGLYRPLLHLTAFAADTRRTALRELRVRTNTERRGAS